MTIAATKTTAQDRLRQIAILISSVDATAARQILLHLPTDTARKVRALAAQLGNVAPDEKRKILAEFQRSAASSANALGLSSTPPSSQRRSAAASQSNEARASAFSSGSSSDALFSSPTASAAEALFAEQAFGHHAHDLEADAAGQAAWTQLNTAALVRFVRDERSAVTAVVISQLAPSVAVEVLRHLPQETSREVLLRLSRLQEIDPEAMQAIDEHLSLRLKEYQHHIQGEQENTRRIQSLLAAAPAELRRDWGELLGDTVTGGMPSVSQQQAERTEQADRVHQSALAAQADQTQHPQVDDEVDILQFPGAAAPSPHDNPFDRGLIQLEFEKILELPPTALAHLLSSTDSQTVQLALAGASPEFMKRFYRMLDRQDAKALEARLQRIGAIQLRDVDEAQRRIVENAVRLGNYRRGLESGPAALRRAA